MVEDRLVLPRDWREILRPEREKPYLKTLYSALQSAFSSGTVFPPRHQIFRAFELCPFDHVRVVILGQDPYHGAGQAHGLCFSVNENVPVPPSLRNIYKELENDITGFSAPVTGDLTGWARQGVLLLNAILTVNAGSPGSHRAMGWETFTDAVIRAVSDRREAVVFMLWGNFAISKRPLIDAQKHLVLAAPHPSPLARGGFFGCRHFSRANDWLASRGLPPVNWQL